MIINNRTQFSKKSLQNFLYNANLAGYASGNGKNWFKETDGSTTIIYQQGKFKFHDNFFGGEPYGGRIIISYAGHPTWIMIYYGYLTTKNLEPNIVYDVLRHALLHTSKDLPLRGPDCYQEKDFTYNNFPFGKLNHFSGIETIVQDNKTIYQAVYHGGLVDVQKGI